MSKQNFQKNRREELPPPVLADEFGKLPPQAIELEEDVLGACLIESSAFEKAAEIVTAETFYKSVHQTIFEVMQELNRAAKPIDMHTVTEQLLKNDKLEETGGAYFITELAVKISSSAHLEYHCLILQEKYLRRELIRTCTKNIQDAYGDTEDTMDILQNANSDLERILEKTVDNSSVSEIYDITAESVREMYRRVQNARNKVENGITTGFAELNRLTNGWQAGQMVILAARPSVGKTAVAIHFARRAAERGAKVAFFSLEMKATEITDRMITGILGVDTERYHSGFLSDNEISKVEKGLDKVLKLPITIDDHAGQTVEQIRAKIKLLRKQKKCDLAIIDYLQLIKSTNKNRNKTTNDEVSEISAAIKQIAKENSITVIALSQLNREIEKSGYRQARLSDLRDSGSLEQDSDKVIFINRPEKHSNEPILDKQTGAEILNYIELDMQKNRQGSTGVVKITHNGTMNDFYDYVPQYNYNTNIPPAKNYYEVEKDPF